MANIHSKMIEFVSENMDITDVYEAVSGFDFQIIVEYLNDKNEERVAKFTANSVTLVTVRNPTLDDIYDSAQRDAADTVRDWLKGKASWISGYYRWYATYNGEHPEYDIIWAGTCSFGILSKEMSIRVRESAKELHKLSDKIERTKIINKAHRLTHRLGGAGKTTMVKWGDFEGRSS